MQQRLCSSAQCLSIMLLHAKCAALVLLPDVKGLAGLQLADDGLG